jgi:hypothetical protein
MRKQTRNRIIYKGAAHHSPETREEFDAGDPDVLKKFPSARIQAYGTKKRVVRSNPLALVGYSFLSDEFYTAAEAWADAREKIFNNNA